MTQYASCWWYMLTHLGLCSGISARVRNDCMVQGQVKMQKCALR